MGKPRANVLFVRKENPCDAKIDVRFKRALTHPPVRSTLLPRGYARNRPLRADIAQLVEQRIRNAKVVGSTPIIGTILTFLQISIDSLLHLVGSLHLRIKLIGDKYRLLK